MGARKQELEVEEVTYWPHQVSGENDERWCPSGSKWPDPAQGDLRSDEIAGKDFCLFKKSYKRNKCTLIFQT